MWKVQLFKLNYDGREREAATQVIENGWLTMGDRTLDFESAFSRFLGHDPYCSAVANGTAALHMALLALDIGPDDEVIIPALTFVADANVVKIVGATPVLADCASFDDWNVSAESISSRITSKTKAVIVVHYAGYPCRMLEIMKLCRSRGISVIEDAAHAPGATVNGRHCGTIGDVGCFSFFSNKNLSIGEGGMVVSCDSKIGEKLRYLRSHGMTALTLDRHKGRSITYDVAMPGLNYRMDEIRSAIGMVQLDKLPAGNERRRLLTERYRDNFLGTPIEMPFDRLPEGHQSAFHILPVLLPIGADRKAVIEALKGLGIQSSIHYPPFWGFSAFAGQFARTDTPIASEICDRELTLPLYPTMSIEEVDLVTTSLLDCL